jgi:hypothetical protein
MQTKDGLDHPPGQTVQIPSPSLRLRKMKPAPRSGRIASGIIHRLDAANPPLLGKYDRTSE